VTGQVTYDVNVARIRLRELQAERAVPSVAGHATNCA
jgi:hypothetical protein